MPGTIITLLGVGAALVATGDSKRFSGDKTKLRRGSLVLATVGFVVFLFGPDLFEPAVVPCEDRPGTEATLQVLSPTAGQTFTTIDVPMELDLQSGKVASVSSSKNRPGEGHLHISIDGRLSSMTGEAEQVLQVPPGAHELEVEFVVNDWVRFTVEDAPA